jgi:hypothetical protein
MALWYHEQHDRLDDAIRGLHTNNLLTNLDEMDGQPTGHQAQHVMMRAIGLRCYYKLCIKYQFMVEIDWRPGHSTHQEGALNAISMSASLVGLKSRCTQL